MEKIFKVTTEGDCEGKSVRLIGYCTGHPTDIKNYFDDQKAYEIRLEEITITPIDHTMVNRKVDILKRKNEIENELKSINGFLKP